MQPPEKYYYKFLQYNNRGESQGYRTIRFGGYPNTRYPQIKELFHLTNLKPPLITITVDRHAITMTLFDYENMLVKMKNTRKEISDFKYFEAQSNKENRGNR